MDERRTTAPIDRVWTVVPALLASLIALLSALDAIDLAYHVRLGAELVETGALPRADTFTFSVPGEVWIDQQWLAQVLLSLLHRAGGWATLGVVGAFLAGLGMWFVTCAARVKGASGRAAALLAITGLVVAFPALGLRPQLFVVPMFTAALWLLADRDSHPRRVWAVPVLAAIAANVHGSFVLIPLIAGLTWIEDRLRGSAYQRRSLWVVLTTVVATLANPLGFGVWRYIVDLSMNPIVRESITEWEPVSLATVPGWLMVASAVAVAIAGARRIAPVTWASIAWLLVFFLLAMLSHRAILWWGLVAPVVVAESMPPRGTNHRREAGSPIVAWAMLATFALLVALLLPWWRADRYASAMRSAPDGLSREIAASLPRGSRLFVHQPWGSWFEYAAPHMLVFIDSRAELYTQSIWEDYREVAFGGDRWVEALRRWDPDAIVAEAEWELIPRLRSDPRWRILHEDADGVVFVRA